LFGRKHRRGQPVNLVLVRRQTAVLSDDIVKFVIRRFKPSDQAEVFALLRTAMLHDGSAPTLRLLRCVSVASGGSLDRLRMEIETLKRDFRDVIVEGEYVPADGELIKVRDLNKPIPDDA
jgi:hypothetical protein